MHPSGPELVELHGAFVTGDLPRVRSILEPRGGFPNAVPDPSIGVPLVYAVYHAPLELIAGLLDAGADPDLDDGDGFPPLYAATADERSDRATIVELLLDAGADPDRRGLNDETPLHVAAAAGDLTLVELLLRRGADPALATRIDDMETPAEAAQRRGHATIADLLRRHE
ncbi:MAG: ankyrin repeat domain-containing protein [Actinomycetota bacterium]